MKLEDQVISLEIAKKLKELGVKQESLWYWFLLESGGIFIGQEYEVKNIDRNFIKSAYTVAELGEMLPMRLRLKDYDYWLRTSKGKGNWDARYVAYHKYESPFCYRQADTEANARGAMLVYLLENKLIPKDNT